MATVVCDTEVFTNYFLAAFKNVKNGKTQTIEMFEGKPLDIDLLYDIMNNHRTVTFNGNHFDLPIIAYALAGATCAQLKEMADDIILSNMRNFVTERKYNIGVPRKWDHIDLIEVAPLQASLKIYNGRLHGKRMQDLPYSPGEILTPEQMEVTKLYCVNDLDATALLLKAVDEPITLRLQMGKENGLDLASKSDAQVAEAVIKYQIEKATGSKPSKPDLNADLDFYYRVPDFISFRDQGLQDVLRSLRTHKFEVRHNGTVAEPDFLSSARIRIGESLYRLGLGGLHSSEESVSYRSNGTHVLIDRDVESYYPRIILNQGLYPKHLGRVFLNVYEGIVNRRVAAKARLKQIFEVDMIGAGDNQKPVLLAEAETMKTVSESLKISINGIFGKLGSPYSVVYAPDLLIQVTLTGQLCLLMLIEAVEAIGIPVVSGNTDGIVMYCPRDREDELLAAIKAWEAMTAFKTEETRYDAIYSRDVNNYFAFKPKGGIKGKGAYFDPWSDPKKPDWRGIMSKNPQNSICIEAVQQRLLKGTPVSDTIRACTDIRKFVTVRTVKGGAVQEGEYLGKAIRWYYGYTSAGPIRYNSNNNKVPKSDGAVPIMDLPDELPKDIDYIWYETEAVSMLADLGIVEHIDGKHWYQTLIRKQYIGLKR